MNSYAHRTSSSATVAVLAALPRDLSSEMDDSGVALATRLEFLRLDRGARAAGRELWDLVKARGRPDLLAAAVREQLAAGDLDAEAALGQAETAHQEAHRARAAAVRRAAEQRWARSSRGPSTAVIPPVSASTGRSENSPTPSHGGPNSAVAPDLVETALAGLKQLLTPLREGATLSPFDAGSLALAAEELLGLIGHSGAGAQ